MTNAKTPNPGAEPQDEDWVEVGKAPIPHSVPGGGAEAYVDDERILGERKPTPPWKYSVYISLIGLVLMALLYVFAELRHFETPWDKSFPTVYPLLVFPVFGLVWGLIALVGQQYSADRARAALGIVLALATFALAYAIVRTDQAPREAATPAEVQDRVKRPATELHDWRLKKLRR